MGSSERVDLAHQADLVIGRLAVSPPRRELVRDDGAREVLEHRVMQVLIALHRAAGGVVTRDELTRSCWDGRIVGDDAINRVISRLRKTAAGIGAGSFTVETITKIGYRLAGPGMTAAAPAPVDGDGGEAPLSASRPTRRAFALGGAALGAVALAGGGTWLYRRATHPAVPPEVERLMARGWTMMLQGNRDAQIEAAGLFRRAAELAPDQADAWGSLGFVYAYSSHYYPAAERDARRDRARAAARRALAIEPGNGIGRAALAFVQPWHGHWMETERTLRAAGRDHPKDDMLRVTLGYILGMVGRFAEAADILDRVGRGGRTLEPGEYYYLIESLWAAGRPEEADRRIAEAAALYPTHSFIFRQHFRVLLFSGRAGAAAALIANRSGLPAELGPESRDALARTAHIFQSGTRDEIARYAQETMAAARSGSGTAGEVLEEFSALGLIDEAFMLADALFLGRGFTVPDRDGPGSSYYHALEDRETSLLFYPSTRAMRADPRFGRLTEALGLERYWREAGVQPDYRRG